MHLSILILLITICILSAAEEFYKYTLVYGRITAYYPAVSVPSDSFVAPSVTECGLRCISGKETCSVAYYTFSTKECRFYKWMDVDLVEIDRNVSVVMDTVVLVQNGYKFLNVRYTLGRYTIPFSEAPAVCQRVGGRLVTEPELEEAKDAGWNRCSFGWNADGRAMFWLSEIVGGCQTLKRVRTTSVLNSSAHCKVV